MRTVLIIFGGLILLALSVVGARVAKQPFKRFLPGYLLVWLICAGINMWIGVSQAGYGVMEELPIFLTIFAIPAAIAWLLARRG